MTACNKNNGTMCLSVLYYNARSLFPKLDDLRANVMLQKPHVVCIVETWLSEDITNHEISLSGYQVQRFDRNRHGGGILVYIHNSLSYKLILQGDPHGIVDLELIVISVSKPGFKLCLGVFYRPPSSATIIFDTLCETLFTIDQSYFSNFVLLGDFNVNYFCNSHPLYQHLCNLTYSFSLTQVVDSPTHISFSQQSSLIDLVFVSNMLSFSQCRTLPQLANSDHLGLSLVMNYSYVPPVTSPCRSVWRYKYADFDLANELLCETDFDQIIVPGDIQTSWIQFKTVFLDIMEHCIPAKLCCPADTISLGSPRKSSS